MGLINYPNKFKFTGKGYLDEKMKIVDTYDDLKDIDPKTLFRGYTVVVLDDTVNGTTGPCEYWLEGTTRKWSKKNDFSKLKLIYDKEEDIVQLQYKNDELGYFRVPEVFANKYIKKISVVKKDADGNEGVFVKVSYEGMTEAELEGSGIPEEEKAAALAKTEYISLGEFIGQVYTEGTGIKIEGNKISLDDAYVEGKIDEKVAPLSVQIDKIAGIETRIGVAEGNIESLNTKTQSLQSQIDSISKGGLTIDDESLEYDESEKLGVKISKISGNFLSKSTDASAPGLMAVIPISGDDTDTEIL